MKIRAVKKLAIFLFILPAFCESMIGQIIKPTDEKILFKGRVSKIGEKTELMSGIFAIYRLMEYRVVKVLQGSCADNKIIVDHLVLSGKELKGINFNSKVCIEVTKVKTLPERMDDNIVRRSADKVDWYYLGRLYRPYNKSPCVN